MNHLCATLLLFCSSFNMSFDDKRNDFVEMIGRCAVEYNAYYTENQNRIPIHLVVAVASRIHIHTLFPTDHYWGHALG